MAEVEYRVLSVPLLARNLISSRIGSDGERVQPSVPENYSRDLSREVTDGEWSVDEKGEPINSKGQNLQEHCEEWISTRPFCLMPVVKDDPSGDCWLLGNITMQGARLRHLTKYCGGNEPAAILMLKEEAEAHGVKFFTTEKGHKPGEMSAPTDSKPKVGPLNQNPWSDEYLKRHTAEEMVAEQTRLIKLGSAFAANIAKAAGKTILGAKLK
jgi:hypothetical protein